MSYIILAIIILLLNDFTTVICDNPFKTTEPLTIIIVALLTTILFISISLNGVFVCKLRKKCYYDRSILRSSQASDKSAANTCSSPRRSSGNYLDNVSGVSIDSVIGNNNYMDVEDEENNKL